MRLKEFRCLQCGTFPGDILDPEGRPVDIKSGTVIICMFCLHVHVVVKMATINDDPQPGEKQYQERERERLVSMPQVDFFKLLVMQPNAVLPMVAQVLELHMKLGDENERPPLT